MFADVILPLRLRALTYKIPEGIDTRLIGHIVKVPLKGKELFGLVINITPTSQSKGQIKELIEVYDCCYNERFIEFINWMASYYISSHGMALKSTVFDYIVEAFTKAPSITNKSKKDNQKVQDQQLHHLIDENMLNAIDILNESVLLKSYKTMVIRQTCTSQEDAMLISLLNRLSLSLKNVIILVPEIAHVTRLQGALGKIFGERLITFHSKLTKSQKIKALMKIIDSKADIILGTRQSIFIPLKEPSLIIVINENSLAYKAEEGLRYNARDIAVRLGYMNNCPVILSSTCPSIETAFNVKARKYEKLIVLDRKKPRIKAILHTFKEQLKKGISQEIIASAKKITEDGGTFLFVGQREGFSMIFCKDCGSLSRCSHCGSSVVFYKDTAMLICIHCHSQSPLHNSCPYCQGFNLTSLGSGMQRIKDEIESFINAPANIIKEITKTDSYTHSLIIGNKSITRQLPEAAIQGAAIIDFDYFIYRYGFRADEVAFQEVLKVACLVEQKGCLYLQTNDIKSRLLTFIKNYNFEGFYNHQLELRNNAGYPPYKRLILMIINIKNLSIIDTVKQIFKSAVSDSVEILGPIEITKTPKGFQKSIKYLLKSNKKQILDNFIKGVEANLNSIKGIELIIDVDPIYG